MKNLRNIIFGAIVTGVLIVPVGPAATDTNDGSRHYQFRRNDRQVKWGQRRDGYRGRGGDHHGRYDRYNYRRNVRYDNRGHHDDGRRYGYYGRGRDHHGRYDRYHYRRDVRHDNRGHHNKPEIRQDFKDIRNARNEVIQGRRELRGDYQELRRDRAELRRDIRNGASKEEIFRDRQEIRADWDEIRKDRAELSRDQARLDAARRELKADLRKR
jgi:hypothetical protein